MFQAGSRVIAGNLAGISLYCTLRPSQGGALPPAGDYEISAPVSDPIYGKLALMTPAGGSAAIPIGKFEKHLQKSDHELANTFASVSGFLKFWRPGASGGPFFVISGQPIVGRSTIIVTAGFADLMDGLQTAGGANVTVA
jgi:hypothetical protein